ncbi:hypothetical protein [Citrobacter cronae]|uniref:hypothetical protein n=1 Tax=Citrobacter cronae TaxID=1748967 RepID=UPI0018686CCB|nr:hypothetical protein [Citrobacter cronae]
MNTLTKEEVQAVLDLKAGYTLGHADVAILHSLARIALDSLDAKPVAWTDAEELRDANVAGIGYLFGIEKDANKFADPRRQIMLYRHAQPAPVVTDERTAFNEWNNSEDCPLAGRDAKSAAWLAWSYRSKLGVTPMPKVFDDFESWFKDVLLPGMSLIKLKEAECKLIHGVTLMAWNARAEPGSQPVPKEWTIQDAVKFCRETGRQDAGSAMDAWNACRAATLQGGAK